MGLDKHPRVCISAGHGYSSRVSGRTDQGADVTSRDWDENDFALTISKRMVADLEVLFAGRTGCKVYLRNSGKFSLADDYAVSHGCDLFWENHLNSGGGTGTEVLYDATKCQHMAEYTSQNIATALHVRDRGDKRRTDLAVLEPHAGMWSLIVEWWFADNKDDLAKWGKYRYQAELAAINSILSHYGWKHVKSLPRKWTRLQRRLYKPF